MKNRFANVGNIMTGDSYVFRKDLERKLLERTVKYDDYGSINVVGLHRMGKSSLVYNALQAKADDFYDKNIIVAQISANEANSAALFFKNIVEAVYEVVDEHNDVDDKLTKYYEKCKNEDIVTAGSSSLKHFFKIIKKSGKRVVFIIDEFDHSEKLFSDFHEGFNILRQLASEPETCVAFVFVSRRLVEQIESKCEGISPFHNILEILYVKSFSNEEMDEYFELNKDSEIDLSEDEQKKLIEITGCQPYWSDIMLKAYKEAKDKGGNADLETIFLDNDNRRKIYEEYENMIRVLNEGKNKLGNKLYQFVFGPAEPDCTDLDADALYAYGIIVDKKNMKLISDKFKEYMIFKERQVDFYSLWYKTETKLREILKNKLKDEYKPNWEKYITAKYILDHPEELKKLLETHFDKNNREKSGPCEFNGKKYYIYQYLLSSDLTAALNLKDDMEKAPYIDEGAEITILEALYTKSLFFLCEFEYWKLHLDEIFGDRKKFIEKAKHLSEARNPYQHSNGKLLNIYYKRKTKEYCEALYECIEKFLNEK